MVADHWEVPEVIHYHGSPLGGDRAGVVRFFSGRHAFVSFANPVDLPAIADVAQSFAIDNGAFTAWKQGGEIDFNAYCDFVREWHRHPGFDWAVIPDVLDGTAEDNDDLLAMWPHDLPGVPVWHLHEPIQRLVLLARAWPRVAIGSSGAYSDPGSSAWWRRMCEALPEICDDGRPITKLHGLRMLNPAVFSKLPLASADSCNAAINSGMESKWGRYAPPTRWQRAEVIASRVESHNSAPVWRDIIQEDLF